MNPGTWNPRSYCRYGPSPCHFSPRSLRSLVGCGKEKVTTIWVRDEWGWREVTQEPNRRRTVQAGNWHLRFPTFIRSSLVPYATLPSLNRSDMNVVKGSGDDWRGSGAIEERKERNLGETDAAQWPYRSFRWLVLHSASHHSLAAQSRVLTFHPSFVTRSEPGYARWWRTRWERTRDEDKNAIHLSRLSILSLPFGAEGGPEAEPNGERMG